MGHFSQARKGGHWATAGIWRGFRILVGFGPFAFRSAARDVLVPSLSGRLGTGQQAVGCLFGTSMGVSDEFHFPEPVHHDPEPFFV